MSSASATELYNQLISAWNAGHEDDVKRLLTQLKIELSELGLLFPQTEGKLDVTALTTAREVLEIGAFQSIRSQNIPAFERYLNLLEPYYNDLASKLPRSSNEAPLFSLSLLRLLSQNRIAEFHTLLETLPKEFIDSTEISWVLSLERSLMEGSYNKVWRLCRPNSTQTKLPRPEFQFFVTNLVSTVRNEIASCDERAYTNLPLTDAKTLLFFDNESEVRTFAKERGWAVDEKGIVHFASSPSHPNNLAGKAGNNVPNAINSGRSVFEEDRELNKEKVVSATLAYAKDLSSIV